MSTWPGRRTSSTSRRNSVAVRARSRPSFRADEPGDVDLEIAHAKDGLGRLGRRPAKHRPAARDEHRHVERLRHVVVGAELQADDHVGRIGTSGQHHDRDAGCPSGPRA